MRSSIRYGASRARSYQTPTLIFSWSGKGSGPPYPIGLAADTAGNVYVISPSSAWDTPGVWVLPIIPSGNANAGTYGAPLLIDDTFDDPLTGKPVTTLALAEVLVAGAAATPVGGAPPAWNPLDLLVLVGDTFNTRVIRYSQAQIQNVLLAELSPRPDFHRGYAGAVLDPGNLEDPPGGGRNGRGAGSRTRRT